MNLNYKVYRFFPYILEIVKYIQTEVILILITDLKAELTGDVL